MEEGTKFHVGLDVHKDSISVAAAELGRAPARLVGKVTHDLNKLLKVLTKIGTPSICTSCTRLGRPASGCNVP